MRAIEVKIFLKSILIWMLPVLISSAGFYDQNGNLIGNYYVLKGIVIISIVVATYFTFRNVYRGSSESWIKNSAIVVGINIFLDLIVLVGLIGILPYVWLKEILPFYLICVPLVHYFLYSLNKKKNI